MELDAASRSRIESILQDNRVVLFMKGTPAQPQCGFSAKTTQILNILLPDYATVDVLADPEIREGIKAYGDWPTIPQLYVDSELVGGCDIGLYSLSDIMYFFGFGGDIPGFFGRYRDEVRSRDDIANVSGLSAGDLTQLRALYP